MQRLSLLLYIVTFFSISLFSQTVSNQKVFQITTNNGLSNGKIHQIAQDKQGFIWIATQNGLTRYDGNHSKKYTTQSDSSVYGVSHNYVYSVSSSYTYGVWVGTMAGLDKYDHASGKFFHYSFYNQQNKQNLKPVWQIIPRSSGHCFLRSDSREIFVYTPGNDTLKALRYKNFKPKAILTSIDSIGKDAIVVSDKSGLLYTVNLKGNVQIIDKLENAITRVKVLKNNTICVADVLGNVYIYKGNKRISKFQFPNTKLSSSEKYISSIEQMNDSLLYIGTRGAGLLQLHVSRGWQKLQDINPLLINLNIETILKDCNNNLWIGHSYGGVSLSFYQYQSLIMLDCPKEVFAHKILSVYLYKNTMYIGTDGSGLFIYDLISKKLQQYNFNTGYQGAMFDNVITSMHADKTHIWLSTYNKGIYAIDLQNGKLAYKQELMKIPVQNVSNVYNDTKNCVWIGTYDEGIYVFDKIKKQVVAHYSTKGSAKFPAVTCDGVTCFFEDSKKNMWLGTYYGLSKIKPNGIVTNYIHDYYPGLKNNFITTFSEDYNGMVWIGSTQGLSVYDEKNDSILAFSITNKIDSNPINNIFYDQGVLWIVSTQAIYKYYRESNKFEFVSSSNIGEFTREAFARNLNSVYFGTEKGIVYLNFSNITKFKSKHKVELTDILIQGKSVFTQYTDYEATFENGEYHIELPYKEDNVTIYFTDFIFDKNNDEEYSYTLENYMDDWTPLNDANFVNFTKLPGGDYIFRVKKKSANPNDTSQELRVHVHIDKAIWEYWYFYMFLGVIVLAIIYAIYSVRLNRVITMRNKLQKQVEIRMEEINSKIEMINSQEEKIQKQNELVAVQSQEIEMQKQLLITQKEEFDATLHKKDEVFEQELGGIRNLVIEKENQVRNFQLLENHTREMVFRILLPSEQFEYVSPGALELTGYSPQEFYDDSMIFRKLIVSEGKDDFKKFRKYMIEGKVPPIMEYKIIQKNEKQKWVAQFSSIIKDSKSQVIALEAVLVDISDKKELEIRNNAAQKRSKKVSQINETLQENQDINKAKTAVSLFCDLLNQDDLSFDEQRAFLEVNHDSSSYMLQMISDLIDISKIEAGKLHLNYSQCYVNTVLQELFDSFLVQKNEMNKKHVALQLNIPTFEENFTFYTDTYRFRQIMMNIVGNGLKFTNHGTVEFGYELIKNPEFESSFELIFFVKDSGKGISKEQIQKIFETSSINSDDVNGVGLAVSNKLVKLLGGKMWVESEENVGTIFKFTLPMEKMKGYKKADPIKTEKEVEIKDWSEKTLLLAEDEENNYDLVREVLLKTKISIIWVKDGEQAVETFKEKRREIDVILMDIQMPVMNGYNATQEIKKIDKEIPIIAQTAYANYESKLNCIKVGCDNYIEKPYKKKDLIEMLAKYI